MNTPNSELASHDSASPQKGEDGPVASKPVALGSSVSADLEALRNDVEQARAMACEYQHQLADKANDHATLKQLFEKAQEDLRHLLQGVTQLREERHQFANDAMKAAALELKLDRVTKERDQLRDEVQALRERRVGDTDERVDLLTRELERVRREAGLPALSPEQTVARLAANRTREQITVPFFEPTTDHEITVVPADAASVARMRRRS